MNSVNSSEKYGMLYYTTSDGRSMDGTGMLIAADLFKCSEDLRTFNEEQLEMITKMIESVGLTSLDSCHHQFYNEYGNDGYSVVILLQESHCAIHTWPSLGKVNVCVYVCNYSTANDAKAMKLVDLIAAYYGSEEPIIQYVRRY